MKKQLIKIQENDQILNADLEFSRAMQCDVKITLDDGRVYKASSKDYFEALAMIRDEAYKDGLLILCKGSQVNVYPSGMCRSMGDGVVAYELTIGEEAGQEKIIKIFDYSDESITPKLQDQKNFFSNWLKSLEKT